MKVTSSLRNEKSILAKLMSTENISVRHAKVPTAGFDPKNRILLLPTWKEMDKNIYDLFVCHEVGHALYTPDEGWHQASCEEGPNFKGYLNIIEDVRIEKKIKRKYPGAKSAMYKGYQVLVHDLDFFGLQKHRLDVNKMNFIDRVNIHYKSGATEGVRFSDEEMVIIDELEAIETWDQVVDLAKRIYEADKESLTENSMQMKMMQQEEFDEQELEDDDEEDEDSIHDYDVQMEGNYEAEWEDKSGDVEEGEQTSAKEFKDDETEQPEENKECSAPCEDADKPEEKFQDRLENWFNSLDSGEGKDVEPKSITDEEYRSNEEELLDEQCFDIVYVTLPKAKIDASLVSYKDVLSVHETFEPIVRSKSYRYEHQLLCTKEFLSEIRNENKDIVNYLVKEFEMKKSAHEYRRQRLSNSGRIDMNKLHSYKTSENIFRRITAVKDGKNHGLVMYVDFSGSMHNCIIDTMIQTYVLMEFCRRVGIAYRVLTFTDFNVKGAMKEWSETKEEVYQKDPGASDFYEFKSGDAVPSYSGVYLVEWFHEKMTAAQHKQQLMNFFGTMLQHDRGVSYWGRPARPGASELRWDKICLKLGIGQSDLYHIYGRYTPRIFNNLWGTPLNDTILHGVEYAKRFKEEAGVELLHSVFLTDGDSSGRVEKQGDDNPMGLHSELGRYSGNKWIAMLYDEKTKSQYHVSRGAGFACTEGFLKYYKDATKSKSITGFHLASKPPMSMFGFKRQHGRKPSSHEEHLHKKATSSRLTKEKILMTDKTAYDQLFCIKASGIGIEDEGLSVEENASQRKLVSAFKKMRSKKLQQRPMLNKFVELVA